jgi:GT2 family glycosyltransferase
VLDLDSARHVVTAVIVSHDGARWLPETLSALRAQTRPVQRVVAADTGSTDGGPDVLADHLPADAVIDLPARTGYGDAVKAALDLPRSTAEVHGFDDDATEWIWLIHDDLTPEKDTLEQLLAAADEDPGSLVAFVNAGAEASMAASLLASQMPIASAGTNSRAALAATRESLALGLMV